MDKLPLAFTMWAIAKRRGPSIAFQKASDDEHGSCLPLFTDIDLADRYIAIVCQGHSIRSQVIPIADKQILGNVLRALAPGGCGFVVVDPLFGGKARAAQFFSASIFLTPSSSPVDGDCDETTDG